MIKLKYGQYTVQNKFKLKYEQNKYEIKHEIKYEQRKIWNSQTNIWLNYISKSRVWKKIFKELKYIWKIKV